LTRIAKIRRPK